MNRFALTLLKLACCCSSDGIEFRAMDVVDLGKCHQDRNLVLADDQRL